MNISGGDFLDDQEDSVSKHRTISLDIEGKDKEQSGVLMPESDCLTKGFVKMVDFADVARKFDSELHSNIRMDAILL